MVSTGTVDETGVYRLQAGHLPTLFNRGMAALFLGRPADARGPLGQAVSRLPEDGSSPPKPISSRRPASY